MSKVIDDSRPYTDEEKEWLLTRADGEELIKINDRRFSHPSDAQKKKLSERVLSDAQKEAQIQAAIAEQQKQDEEDSYHEDDIAAVQPLTIAQLRERLEKEGVRATVTEKDKLDPNDPSDPFTEKEVLAYRLLNHLDKKREALASADQGNTEPESKK